MSRPRTLVALVLLAAAPALAQDYDCCEVTIPAPFDRHAAHTYVRLLYPQFEANTGRLGQKDAEGQEMGAQLYDAKTWKAEGQTRLVVLVETYPLEADGKRPEYGAAAYGLDLALVEDGPSGPKLVAALKDASGHSGHGGADLDLAPYRVQGTKTAIGIRNGSMHMGFSGTQLELFVQQGATFRKVFERIVDEDNTGANGDELAKDLGEAEMEELEEMAADLLARRAKAVVAVVPGTPYNALEVVERVTERRKDGRLHKATNRETWTFDEKAGEYRKR